MPRLALALAGPGLQRLPHCSTLVRLLSVPGLRAVSTHQHQAKQRPALQFCIVGSGPAGFYTADRLLKTFGERARVDVLDRLPTPFGLVRSGVSPDHQDTKNVINQFTGLGRDPRVTFFGNVALGRDVSLQELRSLYNGVVLAYGAESDKKLGIPGENAKNVFSAREFVWWYNGHPDGRDLPVELQGVTSVAIIGIGNVALDCARVLLQPLQELAKTDVAAHALQQIRDHGQSIRDVHLVARRGPVQAACTPKELRELVGLPGLSLHAQPAQMEVSAADQAEMKATRIRRRVYEVIKQAVSSGAESNSCASSPEQRHLHFQFYRSPKEVLVDSQGRVSGVKVEVTQLADVAGQGRVAVATGRTEVIPAQLLLVSIGYRSIPVPGVPFDPKQAVVPNLCGRVLMDEHDHQGTHLQHHHHNHHHHQQQQQQVSQPSQEPPQGKQLHHQLRAPSSTIAGQHAHGALGAVYVVGWLKRGPTGIIATNAVDAEDTVACIAEDASSGRLPQLTPSPTDSDNDDNDSGGDVSLSGQLATVASGTVPESTACDPLPFSGTAGLRALLEAKSRSGAAHSGAVDFQGWERLDERERAAGQQAGKVREKVVDVGDMLRVAHGQG